MPTISKFDRATCATLAAAIKKALEPVAEEFGVALTMRGGSFGATNYQPKMEFAIKAPDGIVLTREAQDFKQMAAFYGLTPEHLGAQFAFGGNTYKITGLAARSNKRPILAQDATGRTFKFSDKDVVRLLAPKGGAS
jgi:hypothetical protein